MTDQPSDITAEAKRILANLNRGGALTKGLQRALRDFEQGRYNEYETADEFLRDMDREADSASGAH